MKRGINLELLEEIIERLSIFKNFYDLIRVLDPVKNKIIAYKDNGQIEETNEYCYQFWKKDDMCKNCIAKLAYDKLDTFFKLEFKDKKVFLIITTPVVRDEKIYILQVIKDISFNAKVSEAVANGGKPIEKFILEFNSEIFIDSLTKVYNKRYIDRNLPLDIAKNNRECKDLSIIMTDVDYFKNINDVYGHLAGDKVLKEFSALVKKSIRKQSDWIARFGGEEFLIVLNNTDIKGACKVGDKIKKMLEKTTFEYEGNKIKVSASFGVYQLKNKKENKDSIIAKADKALYKAKTTGKNKIVIYDDDF